MIGNILNKNKGVSSFRPWHAIVQKRGKRLRTYEGMCVMKVYSTIKGEGVRYS
jgi:hypothetical protein